MDLTQGFLIKVMKIKNKYLGILFVALHIGVTASELGVGYLDKISADIEGERIIDIGPVRNDFREALISREELRKIIFESEIVLYADEIMPPGSNVKKNAKENGIPLMKPFVYSIEKSGENFLESAIKKFWKENLQYVEPFYKAGETRVKLFKKRSIYMFYLYEALDSELELEPGDIIFLQYQSSRRNPLWWAEQ